MFLLLLHPGGSSWLSSRACLTVILEDESRLRARGYGEIFRALVLNFVQGELVKAL